MISFPGFKHTLHRLVERKNGEIERINTWFLVRGMGCVLYLPFLIYIFLRGSVQSISSFYYLAAVFRFSTVYTRILHRYTTHVYYIGILHTYTIHLYYTRILQTYTIHVYSHIASTRRISTELLR